VDGRPRHNAWKTQAKIPARTKESDAMSRALRERGFAFVGSTICYAFMQAAGLVNDHIVPCFRHREVARLSRA
jgi:DNA-3-methyladenine glycosylase I